MSVSNTNTVTLNVGGTSYTTSLSTLTRDPNSMLGVMFSGRYSQQTDVSGSHFIDANGHLFKYVLDFLRRNKLLVPRNFDNYDALLAEAEFFQIEPLVDAIRQVTNSDIVTLNVGGTMYSVPMKWITKYPDSNLCSNVTGQMTSRTFDEKGNCYIDGDGQIFRYILNYLRRDELILPDDFKEFDLLLLEAEHYKIEPLTESIRTAHHRYDVVSVNVGGVVYHTTGKTLRKYPHSSLSRMLNTLDLKGRYVINGNGQLFQYVLDYLRKGRLDIPNHVDLLEGLLNEALLYDLPSLAALMRRKMMKIT